MRGMRQIFSCAFLLASPAWADVARQGTTSETAGWPSGAVVAVTFTVFLALIVVLSRFIKPGSGDKGGNDGGGLFGP